MPYAGTSTAATLALNGGTAYPIYRYGVTTRVTTHYPAGSIISMTFRTSYNVSGSTKTNAWICDAYYYTKSNTVPSVQCETAAATAAKTGTCTNYTLTAKSYVHVNIRYTNTYKGAITLNIDSAGAKPVYLNGSATSSSNYSLTAGTYIAYYDGTNFYFRTDGKLTADITGSASYADGAGYADEAASATNSDKLDGQDGSYYLNYNNFTNKPTIPTVNNGTLTIQVNGTSKGTFTANQSSNSTVNITAEALGLSKAMDFLGSTTTAISDGATTNPITVNSVSTTVNAGDVVLYNGYEYVWTGSA